MASIFKSNKSYELWLLTPKILVRIPRNNFRTFPSYRLRNFERKSAVIKCIKKSFHTMDSKYIETSPKNSLYGSNTLYYRKITESEVEDFIVNYLPLEDSGIISLVLLKCCTDLVPSITVGQKLKYSQQIMSTLKKRTELLTEEHFEVLLQCYLDNECTINLNEFLSDLESANIHINENIFNLLIKCLCAKGQIEEALEVLLKMVKSREILSEKQFAELIYAYMSLGNIESVSGVLKLMKNMQIPVGNSVYTAFLKVIGKCGDKKMLIEYYNSSKQKSINLKAHQVLTIVENLAINKQYDLIPEVFSWKNSYNKGYLQDLVIKLISKDNVDGAFSVWEAAVKQNPMSLDDFGLTFLMNLKARQMPFTQIIKMTEKIVERNVDQYAPYHLLRICCSEGTIDEFKEACTLVQKTGLELRVHLFWPMLVRMRKEGGEEAMFNVLRLMHNFKVSFGIPTLITFVLPLMNVNQGTANKLTTMLNIDYIISSVSVLRYFLRNGKLKEAGAFLYHCPKMVWIREYNVWLYDLACGMLKINRTQALEVVLKIINPFTVDIFVNRLTKLLVQKLYSCRQYHSVLEVLNKFNWKISKSSYDYVMYILPDNFLSEEQYRLLKNIVDEDLDEAVSTVSNKNLNFMTNENLVQKVENTLKTLEENNQKVAPLLKKALFSYIRCKNWKEALKTEKKLLEIQKHKDTPSSKTRLFRVYVKNKDLANSQKLFIEILSQYPDFEIPINGIFEFCALLTEKTLHKDSLKILNAWRSKLAQEKGLDYEFSLTTLMQQISKIDDIKLINKYFEILDGAAQWSNKILSPYICALAEKVDLCAAVSAFVTLSNKYELTPWLVPLLRLASERNDTASYEQIEKAALTVLGSRRFFVQEVLTPNFNKICELVGKARKPGMAKQLQKQFLNLATTGLLDQLLNIFFKMEKAQSGSGSIVLPSIAVYYDSFNDYVGAEKFLQSLHEKNIKIPKTAQEELEEIVSKKWGSKKPKENTFLNASLKS